MRLRDPVLEPQLLVEPGHRGDPRRRGRRRRRARPRRRRRRASRGCAPARGRRRTPVTRAVVVDRHLDDDRQPLLALVERGEVGREPLRQHREDPRPPCRPRWCWSAACASMAEPFRTERVDVGDGDQDLHARRPPAARRPRAGRGRASRRCRSTPRGGRAGRGRPRRSSAAAPASAPVSASASGEKSGWSPRSSIARRAIVLQHLPAPRAGRAHRSQDNARARRRRSTGVRFIWAPARGPLFRTSFLVASLCAAVAGGCRERAAPRAGPGSPAADATPATERQAIVREQLQARGDP